MPPQPGEGTAGTGPPTPAEERFRQVTRLYALLSQISKTIVRTKDRDGLFRDVCRVAVEFGGFRMAWVGLIEGPAAAVRPVANAGHEEGYLTRILIRVGEQPAGKGPTGSALREGKIVVSEDIGSDPRMLPWRAEALARGYRSSAAIPFRMKERVIGTLNLYAGEPGFFTEEERKVLEDIGEEVSFALDALETERKRAKAEEERLELERRLLHAQKLESLGVLAGGIAHDFNNLLMAILGNLDLALLNLPAASPARENIEQSAQAARRATDLTRQMLAYSGRGSFVVAAMDLNALVEENAQLFGAAVPRTTSLSLRLGRPLPPIEADAGQIQQVIMNLITNASDAIGDGAGVISLATGVEECDARRLRQSRLDEVPPPGRFVFVEVADTGVGMDAETQQRLFDPFFTTKRAGRGLGMSAILGIVRGHRGAVFVESVLGRGTTIRVLFPPAGPGAAGGGGGGDAVARGASPPGGTVLVVDDEESVLEVCRKMLAHLGYPVLTAADGGEALAVFRERADEIALVILDLTMPVMDGMTALAEIRRIRPDAKVILSSGYDRGEAARSHDGAGVAGFVQKPYSMVRLREAVEGALGGRS